MTPMKYLHMNQILALKNPYAIKQIKQIVAPITLCQVYVTKALSISENFAMIPVSANHSQQYSLAFYKILLPYGNYN